MTIHTNGDTDMPIINSSNMFLVYVSQDGDYYYQSWQELTQSGTLIDPETGDDMELVGWTTDI
jgi:hypothetical protein